MVNDHDMTHLDPKALEAVARAIYAIEPYGSSIIGDVDWDEIDKYPQAELVRERAIACARAALAALPQAEPVAWGYIGHDGLWVATRIKELADAYANEGVEITPLFASPTPAEPSPATGVRVTVRPLEWRKPTDHPKDPDPDDTVVCADGLGGVYAVSRKQKVGPAFLLWWAHDPMDWSGFETVEAAKAAAQADYEARIRSALGEQS